MPSEPMLHLLPPGENAQKDILDTAVQNVSGKSDLLALILNKGDNLFQKPPGKHVPQSGRVASVTGGVGEAWVLRDAWGASAPHLSAGLRCTLPEGPLQQAQNREEVPSLLFCYTKAFPAAEEARGRCTFCGWPG